MRQEKRDEKRLNKERKLEQRRLELEIARELKKPNEDMCLSDHKVGALSVINTVISRISDNTDDVLGAKDLL